MRGVARIGTSRTHLSDLKPVKDIADNIREAKAHVATFSQPDLYLAVRTVVITILLYAGFFAAYPLFAKHWALWAVAICLRAGLNVRVFIIFHDCCNGTFFRSRTANMLVGRFTGYLQFSSWPGWDFTTKVDNEDTITANHRKQWKLYQMRRSVHLRSVKDPVLYTTGVPSFIFFVMGACNPRLPMVDLMEPTDGELPGFFTEMPLIDRILSTVIPALQVYAGYAFYGISYVWFELAFNTLGPVMCFLLHLWQQIQDLEFASISSVKSSSCKAQPEGNVASFMEFTPPYVPECLKWASLGIEFHHIHHFFSGVPCYLLRSCHDSAPPGTWRYIKYLELKIEVESWLLHTWNPDVHAFESPPGLAWLLDLDTDISESKTSLHFNGAPQNQSMA
ncbi:hypothetical protein WJX75_002039 [Coccomyxa subellipsoidea]|uniref:Fatty acid desaturase domain-containing protein n=1 Tax=Coccomyxa subellipsoidea TaxID=248742 RepID=A0ABR2YXQ3_9CHLO